MKPTYNDDWDFVISNVYDTTNGMCCIKKDKSMFIWGYNNNYNLGSGNNLNITSPTKSNDTHSWIYTTGNQYFTLGIDNNNDLYLAGDVINSNNTLSTNITNIFGSAFDTIFNNIPTNSNFNAFTFKNINLNIKIKYIIFYKHYAIIDINDNLYLGSSNAYGQCMKSNGLPIYTLTQESTNSKWLSVAVGEYFTAAIKTDGTLWTVGMNNFGQLGIGNTINTNTLSQVTSPGNNSKWRKICIASNTCFGLKEDGSLWAWGYNSDGLMGQKDTNTNNKYIAPIQVSNINMLSIANRNSIFVG